ncbi:AAA-like domain-containing protein [Methanospirillum stamsii]|uniref:ATP-binding protein n=1 Tax=Methanospirillum stamsii TaxID=1277351 RepID=A0A2V2N7K4_9EURY|nr:AAA-like domain-containing protein [Methanospirillum stamsii]PWR75829.1 hypothetical protein DLD82_01815 [Methanospirillum stamsii]
MRFFNTAGPVNCQDHYCLPPLSRFNLPEILTLISQKKYFVLHAPRQSGKTSCLLALRDYLNSQNQHYGLYINVEMGQAAREDVSSAIRAIISGMQRRTEITFPGIVSVDDIKQITLQNTPFDAIGVFFSLLSERLDKPFVLMIDEIDSLVGDTLISVLRQIRAGYDTRPDHFPSSVILCGVRDIRDYRIHSEKNKSIITGGSAFNIKAESLRLGNFTEEETRKLCLEHTKETAQIFQEDALKSIWSLTMGQPWLVNALAYEICFKIEEGKNRENPVTEDLVMEAKERLVQRRETHLDQLVDKLKEERVRRVIEPMLIGEGSPETIPEDDIWYVEDLGLITTRGQLRIANPIYQEIIPRILTYSTQLTITKKPAWYINRAGKLEMNLLLTSFQQFFREHSEIWLDRFAYREAGPQLLLQAFLQRIINGGGQITREYGLGMGRTDLFILWCLPDGMVQRFVIECKVMWGSRETTINKGLAQVTRYADRCGADDVYLLIFDREKKRTWDEKIFTETVEHEGMQVTVFGM